MKTGSSLFQHHPLIAAAADYLVSHQTARGDFHPPSSRAGYNEIYDAKGLFTVLQAAYMARRNPARLSRYLDCLDRRLTLYAGTQLSDGSLPLFYGQGPGYVGVTGAVAVVIKLLDELWENDTHHPIGHRCMDYIAGVFRPDTGFRTETNANKLNFHDAFPLLAVHLWRRDRPDAEALVQPATDYVLDGVLWHAEGGFWKAGFGMSKGVNLEEVPHPTLDHDRAWALFEMYGDRYADRIQSSIRANEQHFDAIENYYTVDGNRYADIRARTSLAGLMATFDRYTGSRTFTGSSRYRELLDWSLKQFDEAQQAFRERQNLATGEREYFGVPAQFLCQYLLSSGVLNRDVPESVLKHYEKA